MSPAVESMIRRTPRLARGPCCRVPIVAIIVLVGASAWAADVVELPGTVEAVVPGGMTVATPAGETWMVQVLRNAKVEVTGSAEPDMLQPGQLVRLTVLVDRHWKPQGKAGQITLIDGGDRPGQRLGVYLPGQFEPPAPGDQKGNAPMPMQLPAPTIPEGAEEFLVELRGRIDRYRGGFLTVEVPTQLFRGPMRVEVDEPPAIAVEVANFGLAQPGDRVSAKGPQIGKNMVQAKVLSIQLSNPLGEAKKRPPPVDRVPSRPRQDEPDPFDVAPQAGEAPEQPGPNRAGEPDMQPEPARPSAPAEAEPTPPSEPNEPLERDAQGLAEWVAPKPGSAVPPAIRVRVGGSAAAVFVPCRPVPATEVQRRFGAPDSVFDLRGELPVGRERGRQAVRWEMWVYEDAKLFVDETGMVRYREW